MSIKSFGDWLAGTPVSVAFGTHDWVVPAVQSAHLIGLGMVMASALFLNARVLGLDVLARSPAATAARLTPWLWSWLAVMLVTGLAMIVAEPNRELMNPVFRIKMLLLATLLGLTLFSGHRLRHDRLSVVARVVAGLSLGLWVAVVVCGRWIAYSQS